MLKKHSLKLNLKEVTALKNLLSTETYLQLNDIVSSKQENKIKMIGVTTTFDHFRAMDDALTVLWKKFNKDNDSEEMSGEFNEFDISYFKYLCETTIQDLNVPEIKSQIQPLIPALIVKLKEPMADFDKVGKSFSDILSKATEAIETVRIREENKDLNINMLGVKGLA